MPEGPEVETIRIGLQPVIGKKIKKVIVANHKKMLPQKNILKELENSTIEKIERKGKFLLWYFSGRKNEVALNHFGMTGVWYLFTDDTWKDLQNPFESYKHYKIYFHLTGNLHLLFVNIRTFGRFEILQNIEPEEHPAINDLGPDILNKYFDKDEFISRLKGRKRPRRKEIGKCLLDPKIVAGCGNIYKNEALHLSGINPFIPVSSLSEAKMQILASSLVQVARKALKLKGSTLKDYKHVDGYDGLMQNEFLVYGREELPCYSCGLSILKAKQGDRSSFWCPSCQASI